MLFLPKNVDVLQENVDMSKINRALVLKGTFSETTRGYFRSAWIAVYQFWTHLIWMPKLVKPGKNSYMKVNIDNSCKYFSFLAYQRTVQLLYETLDTSIEDLTAFTVRQS